MKAEKLIIHARTVHQCGNHYFLPYTHWVYLKEVVNYYNKICLLSPIKSIAKSESKSLECLDLFENLEVISLPFSSSYLQASKHFFAYYNTYKKLKGYDVFYARYPIPYGWMSKIFHKDKKRIIHFVGDPIDATKTNPNLSTIKKLIMLTLFKPEHRMYLWACKDASVYTNGFHIAKKLEKKGINATALISSTLNDSDFYINEDKTIDSNCPKLIYVGYLRKAKGVETLIKSFKIIQHKFPEAIFSIVGTGEFESELIQLTKKEQISNVKFLGHIDNRLSLNKILRDHDIFCFGSLSEGSPRVILEAMANGLAVVSTPVGSLPAVFQNNKNILFAEFNDEVSFSEKIDQLISHPDVYTSLTQNAINEVRAFTIKSFIKRIFDEK